MTYPNEGDSGLAEVAQNRTLVQMLFVRDYQRNGGLILPPRQEAQEIAAAHAAVIQHRRLQGFSERHMPQITFLRWSVIVLQSSWPS